jgi:glyoxylase-like metal-dependent hydrolase (beta-lactamase superfamily II)
MKEVLPGVYQINISLTGFAPGGVNLYLIRDGDSYTTIDTGWDTPDSVSSLEAQLADSGLRFSDIRRAIITHCHSDHMGMMSRLKKINKAVTYLHRDEMDLVKVRYDNENSYWPITDKFILSHGVPPAELPPPEFEMPSLTSVVSPDILLKGGDEISIGEYTLRVIDTPGHTPGHISLYEPRRKFLISGDVLLPTIATNAATHVLQLQNSLQIYLNSLSRLKELDIELVLPGHEYPFRNHRKRIEELFEHYRQKREAVLKVFEGSDGARTAYDVSHLLSWTPRAKSYSWDKLNGWDRRLAMLQTIAHLEELAGAKKLTRFSRDGRLYYR